MISFYLVLLISKFTKLILPSLTELFSEGYRVLPVFFLGLTIFLDLYLIFFVNILVSSSFIEISMDVTGFYLVLLSPFGDLPSFTGL